MNDAQPEKLDNTYDFFDKVNWDAVGHNKIDKETYGRIRIANKRLYATLLGDEKETQFFMFKPLLWSDYKEIKAKSLDKVATHEFIFSSCVQWPKVNPILVANIEAGIMTTVVYQILSVSNFLSNPEKALEMIIEV